MSRIEELEKRLAADPNSRMFVQLAEEYRKQGFLENAIEICVQGLTKHPQYPSARVALGRALLEAETFDRARDEFEAVLAQVPDNILANKFLGETYHRLGRYDEAIQKYQIAQTLAPEDAELKGKIEAVKAEKAEGGPPSPRAAPAPAVPIAPAPPAPPVQVATGDAPLEATLVDAPAASPEVSQAPPPVPSPPAMPEAAAATEAPASAEEEPLPVPDESAELAPIPLVDVDGPMVLESPAESYARVGEPVADATSDEPVPVVSPTEPPPMDPAPMEPALTEPPPMEPAPTEPAPMESPPMEPEAFEPPPLEASEAVPVPVPVPVPVEEPLPVEPLPVEPLPVEPVAAPEHAAEPPRSSDDIETPTMAELYAAQGHFDKAVLVYRNLLTRDPNETQYLERIEELEMLANATADSTTAAPAATGEARGDGLSESKRQQTIEVLERWLDDIRRSRGA